MSPDRLAQRLESILGAAAVAAVENGSFQIDGVVPALVVSPETVEQVGGAVSVCAEEGAAMIPWGGGTAMAIGNPPRRADVVIRLGKLARVLEHDAANLTVTVECGIPVESLNSRLAAEKQCTALDPPFPGRATVGGTIAANLNGPRRLGGGAVRDLVIGIKAVLASGQSIKGGGKVVKNVAGYDMSKLFVGSLGTLGVVTEATLRVAPLAEATATLVADGVLARAEEFVRDIVGSTLLPTAAFLRGCQSPGSWRVAIRCDGFSAAVERQLRELRTMARRAALEARVLSPAESDALWAGYRDFPLAPDRVVYRVTVPRRSLFSLLAASMRWNPQEMVCDASVAALWLGFPVSRRALRCFPAIETWARRERGHAVLFAAPAELKTGVNIWGGSPASLALMREIKRQFDPAALLSPGRFVGGL